jgi:hypothetical protein
VHGHLDLRVIAIIDASDAGVAVWHADVGVVQDATGSRLTGGWLLSRDQASKIRSLLEAKVCLTTPFGSGLTGLGLGPPSGTVSLKRTIQAVTEGRARLLAPLEGEQAQRGKAKQLIELVLPEVPILPAGWACAEGAPEAVGVPL